MKRRNLAFALIPTASILLVLVLFLIYRDVFSSAKSDVPQISVVLKTSERIVDFWTVLEQGLNQAADDFDAEVSVSGPSKEGNIEEQIQIFLQEMKKKPDAIILAAADYNRLVAPVRQAREQGIPVLTVDSYINSDDAISQIGTANFEAGGHLANYLKETLPEGSLIAILSYVRESSTAIEREEGVRAGIATYFEILPTLYNNDDMNRAAIDTVALLSMNQPPSAIVALNEVSARGLIQGLYSTEELGDTLFLAFDSNVDIIQQIESGLISATVVQKPYNMGYQAVKAAVQLTEGKTPPSRIDTGSVLVTRENLFSPVVQKLLFPTVSVGEE